MFPDVVHSIPERQLIEQAASDLPGLGIGEDAVALKKQLCVATADLGSDYATALLYAWLLQHSEHGPFIRDFFSKVPLRLARDSQQGFSLPEVVYIVPGAFYQEYRTTGADGEGIVQALRELDVNVERVPIRSVGTFQQNSLILREFLSSRRPRQAMIVSLSKGGADIKWALREEPDCLRNVPLWINVGGTLAGTPLINWVRDRPWLDWFNQLTFLLRGRDYRFFRELARTPGGVLDFPLNLPPHLQTVHIVGFPLRQHAVTRYARNFHARFAQQGPNDSLLMLEDVIGPPGKVLPIWGADHYYSPRWDFRQIVHGMLRYWNAQQDAVPTQAKLRPSIVPPR